MDIEELVMNWAEDCLIYWDENNDEIPEWGEIYVQDADTGVVIQVITIDWSDIYATKVAPSYGEWELEYNDSTYSWGKSLDTLEVRQL